MKSVEIQSFFLSAFSRIWTEYEEILHISLYSVTMRENTGQEKLHIWTFFTQCEGKKAKDIRRKLKFQNYINCLEGTQLDKKQIIWKKKLM